MKIKNKQNDGFYTIINFIESSSDYISYFDLLQHSLDYDCYKEYYINYHIFKDLVIEHNKYIDLKKSDLKDISMFR